MFLSCSCRSCIFFSHTLFLNMLMFIRSRFGNGVFLGMDYIALAHKEYLGYLAWLVGNG